MNNIRWGPVHGSADLHVDVRRKAKDAPVQLGPRRLVLAVVSPGDM
jgi:hypothetical protein